MGIRRHWPLLAALAVLYVALAASLIAALSRTNGHLAYVLDDAYIHMAVAKNLAQHGVHGVTSQEFCSCSSSIVWPLLLALVYLPLGPNVLAPLLLNTVAATVVLCVAYSVWRAEGLTPRASFLGLLILSLCTPLPALVFTGMEHTLHVALTLGFLYLAAKSAAAYPPPPASQPARPSLPSIACLAMAPAMVLARYEALFMIVVVCLLLAIRRRLRFSILLGLLSLMPVVASGLIARAQGWHFLPNSILLKHRTPSDSMVGALQALKVTGLTLLKQQCLLALVVAAAAMLILLRRRDRYHWTLPKAMIWVFFGTVALHLQFAQVGWFYRYEAYLVAAGLMTLFLTPFQELVLQLRREPAWKSILCWAILAVLAMPLAGRGFRAIRNIPRSSQNIYDQQIQIAEFLQQYYPGQSVAANDIGAINYFADLRTLDLWGLSDLEVANARLEGRFTTKTIDRLAAAKDVKIAVVYAPWFEEFGGLPRHWQQAGQWAIPGKSNCQQNVVTFYAVDQSQKHRLIENLAQFSPSLPQRVTWQKPLAPSSQVPLHMAAGHKGTYH